MRPRARTASCQQFAWVLPTISATSENSYAITSWSRTTARSIGLRRSSNRRNDIVSDSVSTTRDSGSRSSVTIGSGSHSPRVRLAALASRSELVDGQSRYHYTPIKGTPYTHSRCKPCRAARARAATALRRGKPLVVPAAALPRLPPGTRRCTDCNLVKPLAGFQRIKTTKAGYYGGCRACRARRARELYQGNAEARAAVIARSHRHRRQRRQRAKARRLISLESLRGSRYSVSRVS
jgi:hypothetical protein